jgi:uncharacterized protein (TIGR03437 family)
LAVATTYRDFGYNFVVITDHNKLTDVEILNAQLQVLGQFLVIKGEEVTDSFAGKPVHLNGINLTSSVNPQHGADVLSTMENDLSAIRQAGGLPYIAHPNYGFALSPDDLKNVTSSTLFEIYNAHPVVNNVGDATHPSVETMWDYALSNGKLLYGIAADDEHNLYKVGGALPGQAWIMVRAESLDPDSITQAMQRGDFYATTGVRLADYQVSTTSMTITVDQASSGQTTVDFIGKGGQLLQRTTDNPATYTFTSNEMYVRAKITNLSGKIAWTQPVYTTRLDPVNGIVNGASFGNEPAIQHTIAPDSIGIASGLGLASATLQAQRQSDGTFPLNLGGTSVSVNGRPAAIYYVSSTQVNFYVPAETEIGTATVIVTNPSGIQTQSQIVVANSAPGIFTKDGTGRGPAVDVDVQTLLGSTMLPPDNSRRFYLYGTGIRGATNVEVTVNGKPLAVDAVRRCRDLPGLDQINITLPAEIINPGSATLVITADGISSNTTTLGL